MPSSNFGYQPAPSQSSGVSLGFQVITDLSVAVSLALPAGTTKMVLSVENSAIRWRQDGVAPTSTVGHMLDAGSTLVHDWGGLSNFQAIQVAAGATVNVSYYGG